jgi:hypothetical protein
MSYDGLIARSRLGWAALGALLAATAWLGAPRASAATLSVCPKGCTYSQISDAVASAHSGDNVRVASGTYNGGFAINKNLTLLGAGAPSTTIRGGGPVITVGRFEAPSEPTVSIRNVTITGGLTQSAFGGTVEALGGGIWIPPAMDFGTGANLEISSSVITGNVAAPATSVDAGFSCGPVGDCVFAHAGGGGIDSWGNLTIRNTIVSNNRAAGPVTSDANGGGIYSQQGTLVIDHSVIAGNRTVAAIPDGRFAEGAGIMFDTFFSPESACAASQPTCRFVIRNSIVSGNSSSLNSTLPLTVDANGNSMLLANGGGIHVGDNIPTTVDHTSIIGNSTVATDVEGGPLAIDGGMLVGDSPLVMRNARVEGNRVVQTAGTDVDVGPGGNVLELDGGGTISNTRIVGNFVSVTSPAGHAGALGGLGVYDFSGDPVPATVLDTVIRGNVTEARSGADSASVFGGGVENNTLLTMRNVSVSDNFARADASGGGVAQGGGIFNGQIFPGPAELTLQDSSVIGNVLAGGPGTTRQGGGLFTTGPVTLTNTRIALNRPDQCFGCSPAAATLSSNARLRAPSALAPRRGSVR